MKHISLQPILKSWLALPAAGLVAIAMSATLTGVHAQNAGDDDTLAATTPAPYAEVQYATLTGTTNTVNLTMLPVVDSAGALHYVNVTIPLEESVSSKGVVTITAGTPTVVTAPITGATSFKAGPYVGPATVLGGKALITVSGPGVPVSGNTEWSLAASTGAAACTYPASATWYVGSPTSSSNPLYARLKKAGITSPAYSYGTLGSQLCVPNNVTDYFWGSGSLIGVSQTGSAITIASFSSNYGGGDVNYAVDQITFEYQ
jgi:hypothetical protein